MKDFLEEHGVKLVFAGVVVLLILGDIFHINTPNMSEPPCVLNSKQILATFDGWDAFFDLPTTEREAVTIGERKLTSLRKLDDQRWVAVFSDWANSKSVEMGECRLKPMADVKQVVSDVTRNYSKNR